jgi:hypothetical protein
MALATSGTYAFQLSQADVFLETMDRIEIRAAAITAEHSDSFRRSLNLELQSWSNRGVLLWAVVQATPLALVQGTATYSLPTNCVQMLDTYYSVPNGDGTYTDRLILPMTRTEYAEIPNKLSQGPVTRYWFQRVYEPVVTTWAVYDGSTYPALINYFYLRQLQDANVVGAEAPDVMNRFLDALCAGVAKRMSVKWKPEKYQLLSLESQAAWNEARKEDREQGPLTIRPNLSAYMRGR